MQHTPQLVRAFLLASLLPASLLAQQPYGDPTPGSQGYEPRLSSGGSWFGNANFTFDIQGGLGGSPAFLMIGAGAGSSPLVGVEFLLDPAGFQGSVLTILSGSQPGEGRASVTLPLLLPATPGLLGATFHAQALIADAGAAAGSFSATQGIGFELSLAPTVFIGTSILNNDPYHVIDPMGAGTLLTTASVPASNNAQGAAFGHGGTRLYVASAMGNTIGMADMTTTPITWSTVYNAADACFGAEYDSRRNWIWTLTNPGSGARELCAIDADETAASFGQVVANTSGVISGLREIWAISPSGRRAVVLGVFPPTAIVIDTDEASPTFMQNLGFQMPVPVNQPTPASFAPQVLITPDDRYALILIQLAGATPAEIARLDLQTGMFFDHNPTTPMIDNIGPQSLQPVNLGSAPSGFALSKTGRFAIVSGFQNCGWIGRLDLDPYNPLLTSFTQWSPAASTQNAWTVALSSDEYEVGYTTWNRSSCPTAATPAFVRLDASTGAVLGSIPLPPNSNSLDLQNLYTIEYR